MTTLATLQAFSPQHFQQTPDLDRAMDIADKRHYMTSFHHAVVMSLDTGDFHICNSRVWESGHPYSHDDFEFIYDSSERESAGRPSPYLGFRLPA